LIFGCTHNLLRLRVAGPAWRGHRHTGEAVNALSIATVKRKAEGFRSCGKRPWQLDRQGGGFNVPMASTSGVECNQKGVMESSRNRDVRSVVTRRG
jgi:hypothetical protein